MKKQQESEIKKLLSEFISPDKMGDIFTKIQSILEDNNVSDFTRYGSFCIGDEVVIQEDRNPIISYDGNPEGFPISFYGKSGIIQSFDKKTMSQKNVFVLVDGEMISGHISKVKKIK